MTLISLEKDKKTVSKRFRKAENFAFIKNGTINIVKNSHKLSKSNEFFIYFNQLNVTKIYIKALGYKTFLKLEALGVEVYFVYGVDTYNKIKENNLLKITKENAKELCTLGHHTTTKSK